MGLRMIEVVVPWSRLDEAVGLADTLGALGEWHQAVGDEQALVRALVSSDGAEKVVREIDERFGASHGYRLMLFDVQATLPRPPEPEKKDKADAAAGEEKPKKDPARIACEELVQKLSAAAKLNRVFVASVVLSAVVASIGLMRDNVAVIIGAMVIAPLLTPNMTLALATTLGDWKLGKAAIRVNLVGVAIALALSVALGLVFTVDPSVREIATRTEVSMADIALALAAGAAGALALTTGLSSAVVGVMVAVALLPPLVVFGILLGSGYPGPASGALLLTAINVACVNIAGVATFLWQRVGPRKWWEEGRAKRMVRRSVVVWVCVLVVLAVLIVVAQA